MTSGWLVGANVVALAVWGMSWFTPLNLALPQGGAIPSQWNVLLLAMQVHPWEAIVPLVFCLDIALFARVLKHS